MNLSPILVLLQVQWLRTRWVLPGIVLGTASACAGLAFAQRLGLSGDNVQIAAYAILLVSIGLAVGIVMMIHTEIDKLSAGLPLRILRLPVANWKIVLAFMAYGWIAVGGVSALCALLVIRMAGLEMHWWIAPSLAVCMTSAAQAWTYSLRDPGPRAGVVTFLLFMAPVVWLLRQDAAFDLLERANPWLVGAAVPLALFAAAVLGLRANRRGLIDHWFVPKAAASTWVSGPIPGRRFRSPMRAQLWYEWRTFGWQLPSMIATMLVLYFLGMPLVTGMFGGTGTPEAGWSERPPDPSIVLDWLSSTQFTTTGLQLVAVASSVLVGGYLFMKAGYWNQSSTHLLTQPISTRRLAYARISVFSKSTMLGLALLAGVMGLINLLMISAGEEARFAAFLQQGYDESNPYAVVAFYIGTLFAVMWVAVWPVNSGWAFVAYAVAIAPAAAVDWLANDGPMGEASPYLGWARAAGSAVLAAGFAFGFYRALRARVLSPLAMAIALAFWAVSVAAFRMMVAAYIPNPEANLPGEHFPHPVDPWLWLGLSLLLVAPVITHPLLVHQARRR